MRIAADVIKFPVTAAVAALALLAYSFPALASAWQLDFAAVSDGQWWRIWTGHLTHYQGNHLFWDLFMFVVLGAACERAHPRSFPAALAIMMAGISAAIAISCPEIAVYRGLSGLDTGLFVWFAGDQIRQSIRREEHAMAMLWLTPCVGLIAKLLFEYATGQTLFVDSSNFQPLVESHLAGAVIGALCYFDTTGNSRVARPTLPETLGS